MADDLLTYYNRELSYLRRLGAEFAAQHPTIAGRLRMSPDAIEDPHVLRLMEGVAFLNARIRRKLDDEFPELTEGLLGQLYPHYLAPIPSMAIVQFSAANDLTAKRVVARGAEIETESVGDEPCRFRTTQDAEVWPIEIQAVSHTGRPLIGPASPRGAASVIRLSLRCTNETLSFAQLAPDRLRFFLRCPRSEALALYELILNNTAAVVVAESMKDTAPVVMDRSAIRPVGFDPDQGMLPYQPRSPLGYRLLTEYFAFPEKFLFFDVAGLAAKLATCAGRTAEIFIYLDRSASELERSVSATSFALGCAPIVNLFRQRAEPIALDGSVAEYPVIGDSRRPQALEVYSVDVVEASSPSGEQVALAPLFGLKHADGPDRSRYWHAARRPAGADEAATEVYLSVVDLKGDPSAPADWVASLDLTCTNRDLPDKLPFGGGHPYLRMVQETPSIPKITCLTAPTPALRLPNRQEGLWRLVSHLTLNHLSLSDEHMGADALRQILRLYDFRSAPETEAMIDSLVSVRYARGTARAPNRAMGVMCRGLDITVEFDEQRTSGSGTYLMAAVLEHFMGLYASINAFTRMTAVVKGRAGVLCTWPPRAGDLSLL